MTACHSSHFSGSLTIISGPAGSGKTTLCDRLLEEFPEVVRVVTTTSRQPRQGEVHGQDYFFLTPEAFEQKIEQGAFYEWAKVHGRYYGSEKKRVLDGLSAGKDLLLNVDVQGAESYRQAAEGDPYLQQRLTTVFIELASPELIKERLKGRGTDSDEEISRRIQTALNELHQAHMFHHRIVSGTREDDYAAFRQIFLKHRESVRRSAT